MTNDQIEDIYVRHFTIVYRVCYAYMKTAHEAEDAAANVFAKLFDKHITFENEKHERAWLLRTAINQCRDALKHWWRKTSNIEDHQNLEAAPPEDNHVLEVVLSLPGRHKDVILLYYYGGYSTAEIAEMLKKPHSTIRYHMSEARKLLKDYLDDEG